MSTTFLSRVALCVCAAMWGCGGGTAKDLPKLVPVTGTLTQGGQPLAGAKVVFEPEKGAISSGLTDEAGRFELYYGAGHKGAVPGLHKVRVSKFEGEAGDELIPPKYNVNSELTQQINDSGPNEVKIEI